MRSPDPGSYRFMRLAESNDRRKSRRAIQLVTRFAFLVAFSLGAGQCSEGPIDDCDSPSFKDPDQDQKSDATETNQINVALYQLDKDRSNPRICEAVGSVGSGSLTNGLNLRDEPNTQCGYRHYNGSDGIDYDDWGTQELLALIETVSALWVNEGFKHPRVQPGDMSKQYGGDWEPDHDQHTKGTEVDVRYVRTDDEDGESAIMNFEVNASLYSKDRTEKLINLFAARGNVKTIYLDSRTNIPAVGKLRYLAGHHHHFHVWMYDPEGDGD